MKINSLTPNIMVADVNATLNFYIQHLNFTLIDTNPTEGTFEWGFVQRDDIGLMFQAEASLKAEYPELAARPLGSALTLYIRVQGIHALLESLPDAVEVIKPLNRTFYGTDEFAIMDPNGYILTFSETP